MAARIHGTGDVSRTDHADRVEAALAKAEALCEAEGLHMTSGRRKVLGLLLREHRALGAYEILDLVSADGTKPQPPTVYRALNFLTEHGFAHRIERLNAYVACTHPGEHHAPAFMICRLCHAVTEAHASPSKGALGAAAREAGFQIEHTVVEAKGLCPTCADTANA